MVDLRGLWSVNRLEALVAHNWDLVVDVLACEFDSLKPKVKTRLLCVVKIGCILKILALCWEVTSRGQALEVAEVVVHAAVRGKTLLGWDVVALNKLLVDGLARDLSVALANQVLRLHVRHVALVAGDVLGLDVVRGTAHPVSAFL